MALVDKLATVKDFVDFMNSWELNDGTATNCKRREELESAESVCPGNQ